MSTSVTPDGTAVERVLALLRTPQSCLALREMRHELIVDMDETLNTNHEGFLRARAKLFAFYGKLSGGRLDAAEIIRQFDELDQQSIETNGWATEHWTEVCHDAGQRFAGRPLTAHERDRIDRATKLALDVGQLYPGVLETLELLRDCGVRMALKTKGSMQVQREKIDAHALEQFFFGVEIVPAKTADSFRELADRLKLRAPVSIGDSPRSDIAPALACGFEGILIERPGLELAIEQTPLPDVPRVGSFPEAVLWLAQRELQRRG